MMRTRGVFVAASMVVVLLLAGLLTAGRAQQEELFRALGTLTEVLHLVDEQYVDEVDLAALGEGLDAGLMEAVDPWAAALEGSEVAIYEQVLESPPSFGLVLGSRLGSAAVRQVLPGSPAEAAGLQVGEIIERIDGVNTRGRPLWRLQLHLAREAVDAPPVQLTVMDQTVEERREVTLASAPWTPRALSLRVEGGVTVVDLAALPDGAADEVAAAVGGAGTAVLDLRNLVWGREEEALAVADLFVAEGRLGAWSGRKAGAREFPADPAVAAQPPVVVVGPMTEGVGEVLASALQASGALLVGAATAGHAPHMAMVHDGDLHLWIPVANWLRPDGEPISEGGLEPDEAVEVDESEMWPAADEGDERDPALERALELARGRHAAAA